MTADSPHWVTIKQEVPGHDPVTTTDATMNSDATAPDQTAPDVPPVTPTDAAPPDAAPSEAAPPDAALPDAAPPEAAPPDASPPDAPLPDAPLPDASPPDAVLPVSGGGDTAEAVTVQAESGTDDAAQPEPGPDDAPQDAAAQAAEDAAQAALAEKRAEQEREWSRIEQLKEDDTVVRGPVVEVVKGGLILDIGLRAFLPASLVEMRRVRDLRPYLGRELEAKILEMDKGRGNVVLSRRAALERAKTENRTDLLRTLQKGQIRKGVVSSLVNFGAFVDLGGVDGLVHVSELSWRHVSHPSEVVSVGQEISVEVTEVDQERGRVSLSYRATQEDPWHQFAREHAIGQIVPGTVTKLVPFGAFVRLDDGIEGLVHVSELAARHVETPEQVVQAGQEVLAKVIDIDLRRRRISLSIKQADEGFEEGEEHFDPAVYGMAATYDAQGNYIYPEGFDPETAEWIEGYEEQRDAWERDYERARRRWEAHTRQVLAGRATEAAPPPAHREPVDEALAALRERLGAEGEDRQ